MRIWKIAAVTALALSSFAADNVAPTKSELEDKYNRAFRAFDTNDFPQALKELDAIDARRQTAAEPRQKRVGAGQVAHGVPASSYSGTTCSRPRSSGCAFS